MQVAVTAQKGGQLTCENSTASPQQGAPAGNLEGLRSLVYEDNIELLAAQAVRVDACECAAHNLRALQHLSDGAALPLFCFRGKLAQLPSDLPPLRVVLAAQFQQPSVELLDLAAAIRRQLGIIRP